MRHCIRNLNSIRPGTEKPRLYIGNMFYFLSRMHSCSIQCTIEEARRSFHLLFYLQFQALHTTAICVHESPVNESLLMQGPIHCAMTVAREEGVLGLWAGATPTIMRNGTNQMCLFWAKNNFDG